MPVTKMPSNVPAPPIRGDWGAESLDLVEIEEVSADERSQAPRDVGQGRSRSRREEERDSRRHQRRNECGNADPDSMHWLGQQMNN
jgi:hypothetical protein